MPEKLSRRRWRAICPSSAAPKIVDEQYAALAAKYTEPHRHYHTAAHIAACLRHFDTVRNYLSDPLAVERAIWFHDAVYDTHRIDNESASAEFAAAALASLGVPPDGIAAVRRLILVTAHPSVPQTTDEQFMVDIDLAILGSSPAEFAAYERQIRQEYKWVPQIIFRRKRKKLLQSFLQQPSIYHTDYFREKFESAARENLSRAVGRGG